MLGESIRELVGSWLCWVQCNEEFNSPFASKESRKELASECEYMISLRYSAMDEIDQAFDDKISN
jgi:hypothetical protein